MSKHKELKAAALSLSPNAQAWIGWAATQDVAGNLIDFAAGQALLNAEPVFDPPPIGDDLPRGVTIADDTNGLVSADAEFFGNPDLDGETFSADQLKGFFTGQGLATIEMNAADARTPSRLSLVWPMVANANGTFTRAPLVGVGTNASAPWIPNANLINPRLDVDGFVAFLRNEFRKPTFNPATPGGPMI